MAKKVYYGVGDTARKVKKMYYGIDGVARKVKKAYIGVNGVARLFWSGSGGKPTYGGSAPALSVARYHMAETSFNGYAVFAGGLSRPSSSYYTYYTNIDAYDSSLTRTNPATLSSARAYLTATTVGNYLIVAGGQYSSRIGSDYAAFHTTVDAYDLSFTRVSVSALAQKRGQANSTNIGNYAIIAGGVTGDTYNPATLTEVYNTSLTRSAAPSNVRTVVSRHDAASIPSYAFFNLGANGSGKYVDAYDPSLTRFNAPNTSGDSGQYAACSIGSEYVIFVRTSGGIFGTPPNDAYNSSLTRTAISYIPGSGTDACGASFGEEYGVCFCNMTVAFYDLSLTQTTSSTVVNRYISRSAYAGDKEVVVVAGGYADQYVAEGTAEYIKSE